MGAYLFHVAVLVTGFLRIADVEHFFSVNRMLEGANVYVATYQSELSTAMALTNGRRDRIYIVPEDPTADIAADPRVQRLQTQMGLSTEAIAKVSPGINVLHTRSP